MKITALAAFSDNYIWVLHNDTSAVVVDPGDAQPVLEWLRTSGCTLTTILLTHHHADHIGGVAVLAGQTSATVIGPAGINGVDRVVAEGDEVELAALACALTVWSIPGHTANHVAYVGQDFLLCGDTLFSAGCGRIFDSDAAHLHTSLERIKSLPGTTRVYCSHEYTLANLAFSKAVEPDNPTRDAYLEQCHALRAAHQPSLPSNLALECAINPFLRLSAAGIRASLREHGHAGTDDALAFAALRRWKDDFRG